MHLVHALQPQLLELTDLGAHHVIVIKALLVLSISFIPVLVIHAHAQLVGMGGCGLTAVLLAVMVTLVSVPFTCALFIQMLLASYVTCVVLHVRLGIVSIRHKHLVHLTHVLHIVLVMMSPPFTLTVT